MKNIHVLKTDKPSRLVKFFTNKFHLCKEILPIQDEEQYQNIYITNDEEIKDCYYFNSKDNAVRKNNNLNHPYHHKIILTDNQDLIKDGVQAIDDEFLEWFVKNPSCEYIKTEKWLDDEGEVLYSRIIPKEEPKQKTLTRDYSNRNCKTCNLGQEEHCELELESKCASYANDETLGDYWISCLDDESDSVLYKQETLNEVAERLYSDKEYPMYGEIRRDGFIKGARWQQEQYTLEEQHVGHTIDELDKEYIKGFNEGSAYQQERSYSEEDMKQFGDWCRNGLLNTEYGFEKLDEHLEQWKQFKKK